MGFRGKNEQYPAQLLGFFHFRLNFKDACQYNRRRVAFVTSTVVFETRKGKWTRVNGTTKDQLQLAGWTHGLDAIVVECFWFSNFRCLGQTFKTDWVPNLLAFLVIIKSNIFSVFHRDLVAAPWFTSKTVVKQYLTSGLQQNCITNISKFATNNKFCFIFDRSTLIWRRILYHD